MTPDLLNKFLNDQCAASELEEVMQWIKKEALTDHGRSLGINDWKHFTQATDQPEAEQYNSMLHKIHQKIISQSQEEKRPVVPLATWLVRVAAILLLPVLGLLFYTLTNPGPFFAGVDSRPVDSLQIVTPLGSRTVVQLPDGSEVHLNHQSRLTYPQRFSSKSREVILEGEAYFRVIHNPDIPFVVKTGELNVKALGTEFNVLAYPGGKVVSTTLINGKVVLEKPLPDGKTSPVRAMVPGQHIDYYPEGGNTELASGKIEKYIAWKDGKLMFDNESILKVAEDLSRMFNVDIEVAGNAREFTYTVTFVDEPLFQILDLMKVATPVNYKVFPRKKLADGTFSKQKIRIERK